MREFVGEKAESEARLNARKKRAKSSGNANVHITPYGTRYVWLFDLLFTPEEIEEFADEALAEHSEGERAG